MIYVRLFINFFMTGLLSIGGGLATLPFLYEMSDRTGWFTYHEIADMLAVSESSPGAIGTNMSTYVGYKVAGVPGSIVTSIALITPSIIIILLIAHLLKTFSDSVIVKYAFHGLKPASLALITAAGISAAEIALVNTKMIGSGTFTQIFDVKSWMLAIIIFIMMRKFKRVHPVVFIGISALVGIVFSFAE